MNYIVEITGLMVGGRSIGVVSDGPKEAIGKKAMVWGAAPGEKVACTLEKDFGRYLTVNLVEIVKRSPSRVEPRCKYFSKCGGCDLQFLDINAQRSSKLEMIKGSIERHLRTVPIRGYSDLSTNLPTDSYRNRVTLQISEDGAIGFFERGTHDVVEIESCLISTSAINRAISTIQDLRSELKSAGAKRCILEQRGDEIFVRLLGDRDRNIKINRELKTKLNSAKLLSFSESQTNELDDITGHFSQVNNAGNSTLHELVSTLIKAGNVTELYAGSGNFSFKLLEAGVKKVTAVELDPVLVKHGIAAAKVRGLSDRLDFICNSADEYVEKNPISESVLLDPPRTGALKVCKKLSPRSTSLIVYVSCSLPSLTTDLKALLDSGFKLEEIFFVDMFPQTHHVETVTLLSGS